MITTEINKDKWTKWIGVAITILVLVATIVGTNAVVRTQVEMNTADIVKNEDRILRHETRITINETKGEGMKEQLNRIESKLDKALGINQ